MLLLIWARLRHWLKFYNGDWFAGQTNPRRTLASRKLK